MTSELVRIAQSGVISPDEMDLLINGTFQAESREFLEDVFENDFYKGKCYQSLKNIDKNHYTITRSEEGLMWRIVDDLEEMVATVTYVPGKELEVENMRTYHDNEMHLPILAYFGGLKTLYRLRTIEAYINPEDKSLVTERFSRFISIANDTFKQEIFDEAYEGQRSYAVKCNSKERTLSVQKPWHGVNIGDYVLKIDKKLSGLPEVSVIDPFDPGILKFARRLNEERLYGNK